MPHSTELPDSDIKAQNDYYSFNLDNNGNLTKYLYVLANDKGSGIRMVSYKTSPGFKGFLTEAGVGAGMHFKYQVNGYR
jgi:hypothetical protein